MSNGIPVAATVINAPSRKIHRNRRRVLHALAVKAKPEKRRRR